jgi:hypothetical protein
LHVESQPTGEFCLTWHGSSKVIAPIMQNSVAPSTSDYDFVFEHRGYCPFRVGEKIDRPFMDDAGVSYALCPHPTVVAVHLAHSDNGAAARHRIYVKLAGPPEIQAA